MKGVRAVAQTFSDLPQDKQQQILDAAAEVFAEEDYKRASTDDIAARAGISKGLLFYYFKNKQSLYLYVADHLRSLVERHLEKERLAGISDFFDMLDYGAEEKFQLFRRQQRGLFLRLLLFLAGRHFLKSRQPVKIIMIIPLTHGNSRFLYDFPLHYGTERKMCLSHTKRNPRR